MACPCTSTSTRTRLCSCCSMSSLSLSASSSTSSSSSLLSIASIGRVLVLVLIVVAKPLTFTNPNVVVAVSSSSTSSPSSLSSPMKFHRTFLNRCDYNNRIEKSTSNLVSSTSILSSTSSRLHCYQHSHPSRAIYKYQHSSSSSILFASTTSIPSSSTSAYAVSSILDNDTTDHGSIEVVENIKHKHGYVDYNAQTYTTNIQKWNKNKLLFFLTDKTVLVQKNNDNINTNWKNSLLSLISRISSSLKTAAEAAAAPSLDVIADTTTTAKTISSTISNQFYYSTTVNTTMTTTTKTTTTNTKTTTTNTNAKLVDTTNNSKQQQQLLSQTVAAEVAEVDTAPTTVSKLNSVSSSTTTAAERKNKLFTMDIQYGIHQSTIAGAALFGIILSMAYCLVNSLSFDTITMAGSNSHIVVDNTDTINQFSLSNILDTNNNLYHSKYLYNANADTSSNCYSRPPLTDDANRLLFLQSIAVPVAVTYLSVTQSYIGEIIRSIGQFTWNTFVGITGTCPTSNTNNNNTSTTSATSTVSTTNDSTVINDEIRINNQQQQQGKNFINKKVMSTATNLTPKPDTVTIADWNDFSYATTAATTAKDDDDDDDDIEQIKQRILHREEMRQRKLILNRVQLDLQRRRIREKMMIEQQQWYQKKQMYSLYHTSTNKKNVIDIVRQLENEIEFGFQQSQKTSSPATKTTIARTTRRRTTRHWQQLQQTHTSISKGTIQSAIEGYCSY